MVGERPAMIPRYTPKDFIELWSDRTRYAKVESAYAALIARDPDELDNYRFRSQFRTMTWDWPGAIADFDTVIEREPDAQSYLLRAGLKTETGDLEGALADAEAGWDLDPSLDAAFTLANLVVHEFAAAGSADFQCAGSGTLQANWIKIAAIKVGNLTNSG